MKIYSKTALSLLLSVAFITTSSAAGAWSLFGDDKDPLKDERRAPVLNQSGFSSPPTSNNGYGSMPAPLPVDEPSFAAAPTPLVQQSPMRPVTPLNAPQNAQMVMPRMPAIPEPPQFGAAPQPQYSPQPMPPQLPPMRPQASNMPAPNYVGSDGFPRLNSIPPATPQNPAMAPLPVDSRAQNLRNELQSSQITANDMRTPQMQVNMPAPQPMMAPQMPQMQMPAVQPMPAMKPRPLPPVQPMVKIPEPPQFGASGQPMPQAMPQPVMQQQDAGAVNVPGINSVNTANAAPIAPVFPTGPSVTVRSKRAGGAAPAAFNTASIQPPQPVMAPPPVQVPPSFSDAPQPISTPLVQATPMQPAPKAFAPAPMAYPQISREKYVAEANAPVASSYDTPIDTGFNGVANTSFTAGGSHGGMQSQHSPLLPASRYERYRKSGHK